MRWNPLSALSMAAAIHRSGMSVSGRQRLGRESTERMLRMAFSMELVDSRDRLNWSPALSLATRSASSRTFLGVAPPSWVCRAPADDGETDLAERRGYGSDRRLPRSHGSRGDVGLVDWRYG